MPKIIAASVGRLHSVQQRKLRNRSLTLSLRTTQLLQSYKIKLILMRINPRSNGIVKAYQQAQNHFSPIKYSNR